MTTPPMLRLHDIGKRYGRAAPILDGVSLDIGPGQVVGIVGDNGSGKSTLLRIMAGLSRAGTGTRTGDPSIGYLPDRFPAGTRMHASAYLTHQGRLSGMSTTDAKARGNLLLQRLGLRGGTPTAARTEDAGADTDTGNTALRELSKGNAQKVGLAQAFLHEPRLLLLDEPFSGLDEAAHDVLLELIAEQRERGASVVFTEHRPEVAARHATALFRLDKTGLTPLDPALGPRFRVVLVGADGHLDGPGVLSRTGENGRVELVVHAAHCDRILLRALQNGASVREVTQA